MSSPYRRNAELAQSALYNNHNSEASNSRIFLINVRIFDVLSDLLGGAAILGLEVYILGKLAPRQVQLKIIYVLLFHKVTYINTTVSLPSSEIGTPLPPLP